MKHNSVTRRLRPEAPGHLGRNIGEIETQVLLDSHRETHFHIKTTVADFEIRIATYDCPKTMRTKLFEVDFIENKSRVRRRPPLRTAACSRLTYCDV
ncbi:hypothetical protein EVAR_38823_1 [Eumeta japonica]|uniref:Uncharacterized protein n=1 Tax=Eumeta variegata TaxID=151549 RepID=A0A4C1XTE7_EUMVA|nr:hypothetical protein EVAR_38823_1 [Eumeta japonica]